MQRQTGQLLNSATRATLCNLSTGLPWRLYMGLPFVGALRLGNAGVPSFCHSSQSETLSLSKVTAKLQSHEKLWD